MPWLAFVQARRNTASHGGTIDDIHWPVGPHGAGGTLSFQATGWALMPPPPRVIMVRRFEADVSTLMAAWTKPPQIAGWWARDGAQLMFAEANPIAGGRFIFITRDAEGTEHEYRGIYREIVPGDSIVIDWAKPAGRSLVLQFWPINGGAELTLTESPFDGPADRDARINRWSDALERLRTQVERRV